MFLILPSQVHGEVWESHLQPQLFSTSLLTNACSIPLLCPCHPARQRILFKTQASPILSGQPFVCSSTIILPSLCDYSFRAIENSRLPGSNTTVVIFFFNADFSACRHVGVSSCRSTTSLHTAYQRSVTTDRGKHRALRPQKPLRLISDGEVGGSGILYLIPTCYTITTRMILH